MGGTRENLYVAIFADRRGAPVSLLGIHRGLVGGRHVHDRRAVYTTRAPTASGHLKHTAPLNTAPIEDFIRQAAAKAAAPLVRPPRRSEFKVFYKMLDASLSPT